MRLLWPTSEPGGLILSTLRPKSVSVGNWTRRIVSRSSMRAMVRLQPTKLMIGRMVMAVFRGSNIKEV